MDKFIQVTYAATQAFAQALVTFAQVRADQEALLNMTESQIQALSKPSAKSPIGFNQGVDAS